MTISRAARLLLPSALLIGLGLLAPGLVGAASVTIVSTGAQSFTFSPGTVAIDAGSSVTWTNRSNAGSEPHTVTSDSGAFSSEILEIGQTYTHTFNRAGRFAYHCEVHPEMTGVVVVTGGGQATPKPTPAPTPRPTPPATPKPTVAPTKTPSPTATAPAPTPQPTHTATPTPARTAVPTARPTSRPTASRTAVTSTPSATVAASPQRTATPAPTANPTASDVIAASPSAASAAPVTTAGSSAAGSVPVTTATLAAVASTAPSAPGSPPGTAAASGSLSGAQPAASGESSSVLIVAALALLAALGVGAVLLRGRRSG